MGPIFLLKRKFFGGKTLIGYISTIETIDFLTILCIRIFYLYMKGEDNSTPKQCEEILRSCSRSVQSNVSKIVIFVCVLIKYLSGVVKCVLFCSKVNFITNITNYTRIHTFYFYNNKHTFINKDTTFTTKHTNFIKINTDVARLKYFSNNVRL